MAKLVQTKIYAGRIKDQDILMKSSSGGAFTALSDYFIRNGCAVASTIYNYENHTAEFDLITNEEMRNAARGSKYMQSNSKMIFSVAEDWLNSNSEKKLLFVGTGCQCDGFRKYMEMKGLRKRVYIIDMICHGVPSPKLWREYAKVLEKKYYGKITKLNFKDKRNGWQFPTTIIQINNREIEIKDYIRAFTKGCMLRPSCHKCPYTMIERKTDMTIGDFWHIEKTIPDFFDPAGTSLFLIHTDAGEEIFNRVKKDLEYRESNRRQCWQMNLEKPTPVFQQRTKFWSDYQKRGVKAVMKKYGRLNVLRKVKNELKKVKRKLR